VSPVLLRLDDLSTLEDLRAHLVRSGFRVEYVGDHILDVSKGGVVDVAQERDAVSDHLAVWRAANPQALVTVVPYREV
jgi:hypothetical protein